MEKTHRIFQISSDLFWGFRCSIDLSQIETLEQVIDIVKLELKTYLLRRNLMALVEKISSMKLHMHSPSVEFSELLDHTNPSDILYLCDHCKD